MINIITYDGKILIRNGLIAANTNCCCGGACGCKFGNLGTEPFNTTSAGEGSGPDWAVRPWCDNNALWSCDGGYCEISPRALNYKGILANYFNNSNINVAFQELADWLETLGYCVQSFCSCTDMTFPTNIPTEPWIPLSVVDVKNLDPDPIFHQLDPSWALSWPCVTTGVVTQDNLSYYQEFYPDIQVGDCYLFREITEPDPEPGYPIYNTISVCDDPEKSPAPCAHCCLLFGMPYCSLRLNCCNDCGNLGPIVNFTGTIPILLTSGAPPQGEVYNWPASFDINGDYYSNNIVCETGCLCPTSGAVEGGWGVTVNYIPGETPEYKYLTAQARLCRSDSCCIGPSGAEELGVAPGTCSYAFATETECECRAIQKRLCCILHTRDVKGSLNGLYAADKVGGVKTNLGLDETVDSCPGGVYEDLEPPGYGPGNYNVSVYECAYQHEHTTCGFDPDLLPGWQMTGSSYTYTGVGVPSPDTVYTLGRSDAGNRKYTWAGGPDSESFNMEISESAPGEPFYCKWKSKEWYYEWRWVNLENTYTCGTNTDLSMGFPGVGGNWFCGAGSDECPTVSAVTSDPSQYTPETVEIALINSTQLQCGPQWGTWNDGVCGEVDCGQQLP